MLKLLTLVLLLLAIAVPASAQLIRKEQIEDVFARKAEAQTITGNWTLGALLKYDDATPAQITADQNNYALSTKIVHRLSTDATRAITGFAGGTDGDFRMLANVGSFDITLVHQSGSSTAANQIATVTGADLTMGPAKLAVLLYDSTTQKWRAAVLGASGGGAGTPGGSSTQVQFNDATNFGGDAGLTYDKTTDILSIVGGLVAGNCATNCLTLNSSAVTGAKTWTFPNSTDTFLGTAAFKAIPKQISFRIGSDTGAALVDTQDEANIWENQIAAMTMALVKCETDQGTSTINLQRNDGSPANILSSNLVCTTSGASTTTFVAGENALSVGHKVSFVLVQAATSGTPKRISVTITATLN